MRGCCDFQSKMWVGDVLRRVLDFRLKVKGGKVSQRGHGRGRRWKKV